MSEDPALRLAVRALQVLAVRSRCWTSRQMALRALAAVAKVSNLEREDDGLPETVVLHELEKPNDGNYLKMWGH